MPATPIEMFPQSIANYTFPTGPEWVSRVKARQAKAAAAAAHTAAVPATANLLRRSCRRHGLCLHRPGRDVWLITGAQGFVGGWVIKALLSQFHSTIRIVAHDMRHDDHILAQILSPHELGAITRVYGDISHTQPIIDLITAHSPDPHHPPRRPPDPHLPCQPRPRRHRQRPRHHQRLRGSRSP